MKHQVKMMKVERRVGQKNQNRIHYLEISAILVLGKIVDVVNRIDKMMDKPHRRKTKRFTVRRRVKTIRRLVSKDKRSVRKDHRQLGIIGPMGRRMKVWMKRKRRVVTSVVEIVPKIVRRESKIWKMKLLAHKGLVQLQEATKGNKTSNNLKRCWLLLKRGNWEMRESEKMHRLNIHPSLANANSCHVLASINSENGGLKELKCMSQWTRSYLLCPRNCLRSLMIANIISR